jgi:hypothetical protein
MQHQPMTTTTTSVEERHELGQQFSNIHFWSFLQSAGMAQMADLALTQHQVAPKPGSLVYVDAQPLPIRMKDFNLVVFSAIDLCTMLQIGRLYLTSTVASSVDFLQFMIEKYPFLIEEIRTPADGLFMNSSTPQPNHHFTALARQHGIFHSMTFQPNEDRLLNVMGKYFFTTGNESQSEQPSESKLLNDLINFLFFHNNHRSIPLLGGKTPFQKLTSFESFDHLVWFDPYEAITPRTSKHQSRKL